MLTKRPRIWLSFWLGCALTCSAVAAEPLGEAPSVDQVRECVRDNFPLGSNLQTIELRRRDKVGNERTTRAVMYRGRDASEHRRFLMRVSKPADLEGAAFLLLEGEGENEVYVSSPALDRVKRITGTATAERLFGTDFSYEDLERLQGFVQPGASTLMGPDALEGRETFVIKTVPAPETGSAYNLVVTHVDREMCVVLQSELHSGGKLRKKLVARPGLVRKVGRSWVPHDVLMRDMRDETETRIVVVSAEADLDIPDEIFTIDQLERWRLKPASTLPRSTND